LIVSSVWTYGARASTCAQPGWRTSRATGPTHSPAACPRRPAKAHAQLIAKRAPRTSGAPGDVTHKRARAAPPAPDPVRQGAPPHVRSPPTAHALAWVRFCVSTAFRDLAASSARLCASGAKVTDKMVPPVQVSPLIKLGRYSALFLGVAYGAKRYSYLKPRAEEERRIAAEEKKKQDELKRIERELAEAQEDTILK
uniref:ATP synthase F(0) complex subunit e, mitochondrial n=1 Tax=Equus caballus TaxID=9796 RepID=A0A9L0T5S4_HORSE